MRRSCEGSEKREREERRGREGGKCGDACQQHEPHAMRLPRVEHTGVKAVELPHGHAMVYLLHRNPAAEEVGNQLLQLRSLVEQIIQPCKASIDRSDDEEVR